MRVYFRKWRSCHTSIKYFKMHHDLPHGWTASFDSRTNVYFFTNKAGESTWEYPTYPLCLNTDCTRPARKLDAGDGFYDYCGKSCAQISRNILKKSCKAPNCSKPTF